MFLKIRDEENRKWWYVFNVDRIVVSDSVEAGSSEALEDKADLEILSGSTGTLSQTINCIVDQEDGRSQKEYRVSFNTRAFLCTDHGDTVESFLPNPKKKGLAPPSAS